MRRSQADSAQFYLVRRLDKAIGLLEAEETELELYLIWESTVITQHRLEYILLLGIVFFAEIILT